jgi:hypothetical protein
LQRAVNVSSSAAVRLDTFEPNDPRPQHRENITKEAADVANFAMMVADVAGNLRPAIAKAPEVAVEAEPYEPPKWVAPRSDMWPPQVQAMIEHLDSQMRHVVRQVAALRNGGAR